MTHIEIKNTLTLIIATYNRGPCISETLDSVLCQNLKPLEIIVVDDGSTDSTAEYVKQKYPMVNLIQRPNGGTSAARNTGAANASGSLLMFLDHDDRLKSNALATFQSLIASFPHAKSWHSDHEYHDTRGGYVIANHHEHVPSFARLSRIKPTETIGSSRYYAGTALYRALLKGNLLQQPYVIAKDAFNEVGGYRENIRYCEDWDLYLRVSRSFPVALSDLTTSEHIVHGANLHLADESVQLKMYEKVLRHQLAKTSRWKLIESWIIRKKLQQNFRILAYLFQKQGKFWQALKLYMKAFICFPLGLANLTKNLLSLMKAALSYFLLHKIGFGS